jgi:hypothetical protein
LHICNIEKKKNNMVFVENPIKCEWAFFCTGFRKIFERKRGF